MAKLQGQITSTTGLSYEGTWDARNSAEGGSSDGGNPDLSLTVLLVLNYLLGQTVTGLYMLLVLVRLNGKS